MPRNHPSRWLILLAFVPLLASCIEIVEGVESTDEVGEAETETGTETDTSADDTNDETGLGTSDATDNETDADPDPDAETSTGMETDTGILEDCEVSFELGASDQDCSFAITCSDSKARAVECNKDGCSCLEADTEVGNCVDSTAICGAHDVGAVQGCCGWQL